CTSGIIWLTVRERWFHGFTTIPLKPPAPEDAENGSDGENRIWKVVARSGKSNMIFSTCRPKKLFWSAEALPALLMMPNMNPWSSVGASSLLENIYMGMVARLSTAH